MTSIEDQLSLYAGAITDQRPPLSQPDRSRAPAPRHHRGAFAIAAAVLVVVVIGVAALALRGGEGPEPVTTTTTEGQIITELSLSTDTPAAGETVTAKVTITNDGAEPVKLRSSCFGPILTPGASPSAGGTPGQTRFETDVQVELGLGRFVAETPPVLTLDQLQRLVGPDAAQATADLVGCDDAATIEPGDHATITSSLDVSALGMAPGPGLVSTTYFGTGQPANVSIPITIPEAPEGVLTRARAVEQALAQPPVQETIASLPEAGDVGATSSSTFFAWPIANGWQVGYAQSTGQAFLVTITPDSTRIDRAGTSP